MDKETMMHKRNERLSNSEIYARINALPLTPVERAVAIRGLIKGAMIADAILWVLDRIKRLAAGTTGASVGRLTHDH
jgi:hypothetical protein